VDIEQVLNIDNEATVVHWPIVKWHKWFWIKEIVLTVMMKIIVLTLQKKNTYRWHGEYLWWAYWRTESSVHV
jgi:hypothetical protein